jgi:hypothetical protein
MVDHHLALFVLHAFTKARFHEFAGLFCFWHIASVQPIAMSAVPWNRTCRLREGADRLGPIEQTEHVRLGKGVHTEE